MVPVIIDPARVRIALAGGGPQALRRLRLLETHGAAVVAVFAPQADPKLQAAAGALLRPYWPGPDELRDIHVLYASDIAEEIQAQIARAAREAKTLINIEDQTRYCDFHAPATVRRGPLLFTVSTGGAAPGLARRLAQNLSESFGPDWEEHVAQLAAQRAAWRQAGMRGRALADASDRFISDKGWLR